MAIHHSPVSRNAVLVLSLIVLVSAASAQEQEKSEEKVAVLPVKLGSVPTLPLAPRTPLPQDKIATIKACIAKLADIESPDFGLSPTMSGEAFLPLPGQRRAGAMLLTNHQLRSSDMLKSLVEMGPDALPYLLDALSDKAPTKLKLTHNSAMGAMWYGDELWGNPVSAREVEVLKSKSKRGLPRHSEDHITEYTVKVGDVCFVAIGQITGRGYQAVRYQPTACIVINSPTERAELREKVRQIWKGDEPARHLLNSLLTDYATEGVYNGHSFDGWSVGSDLQAAAALRLLYYFPKETTPLIADRLKKLKVERTGPSNGSYSNPQQMERWTRRELANGVRTDEFVKAVSWCKEQPIREALQMLFRQTEDVDILVAAAPAVDDKEEVRTRLEEQLNKHPGEGYMLLPALAQFAGNEAKGIFQKILTNANPKKSADVCQIVSDINPPWTVEVLRPLLDDKRTIKDWKYPVRPDQENSPSRNMRVCDVAAEALTKTQPEFKFKLAGEYKDLDAQIENIKKALADKKP